VLDTFTTILLTGGTGSFGTAMTSYLLAYTDATIRIYSRGEALRAEMQERFRAHHHRLRFLAGDVRDEERLRDALAGVNLVIHCAALKRIEMGEYDPMEFIKTNVMGTFNVMRACRHAGVRRALFLSTDKSVQAINVYGSGKALGERLWSQGNAYAPEGTEFVAVRYGNVSSSRGSVIPLWRQCLAEGNPLLVTDLSMTRFYISLQEAVETAIFAINHAPRGSIIVPHLPAYTMGDLAQALIEHSGLPHVEIEYMGLRAGEKWHEMLVSEDETLRLTEYMGECTQRYYCIPAQSTSWTTEEGGRLVSPWQMVMLPAPYESQGWPDRLNVSQLRELLEGV